MATSPLVFGPVAAVPPTPARLPAEPVVIDDPPLTDEPEELAVPALLVPGDGGTATLAELPAPLGSLPELLRPPTLAGPDGTPLTADVPAPAEPAFGEPTALPVPADGPLAAPPALPPVPPPVPWANELAEAARIAIATIEAVADILLIWKSPFRDSTAARVAGSAPERFPPTAIEPAQEVGIDRAQTDRL
jgi:hypothetical protein